MEIKLLRETRLAPGQTRIVPLVIVQTTAYRGDKLTVRLVLESEGERMELTTTLSITQQPSLNEVHDSALVATYFYAKSAPTAYLVTPPLRKNAGEPRPPILALRKYLPR